MTLVQLRHLIALAQSASFSRAAEAVHLTQPALSRSIQALEEELGVALFDRIGRRAELTPMGREAVERARQVLFDAQELEDRGRAVAEGRAGTLRIGMGSGPGALLMTPLLLDAAVKRPQWRVEVARGATDLLLQRLRARTLDAVVADLRSFAPTPDLETTMVRELRGAFMVRPGHPLARKQAVTFDELRGYPLASTPLSAEIGRRLAALYGPNAHPDQAISVRCEDIASLIEVTESSDAVLLSIRAGAPHLVALPMDPPMTASARLGLVTLARRTQPVALEVVRRLMEERLAEGPSAQTREKKRARRMAGP